MIASAKRRGWASALTRYSHVYHNDLFCERQPKARTTRQMNGSKAVHSLLTDRDTPALRRPHAEASHSITWAPAKPLPSALHLEKNPHQPHLVTRPILPASSLTFAETHTTHAYDDSRGSIKAPSQRIQPNPTIPSRIIQSCPHQTFSVPHPPNSPLSE